MNSKIFLIMLTIFLAYFVGKNWITTPHAKQDISCNKGSERFLLEEKFLNSIDCENIGIPDICSKIESKKSHHKENQRVESARLQAIQNDEINYVSTSKFYCMAIILQVTKTTNKEEAKVFYKQVAYVARQLMTKYNQHRKYTAGIENSLYAFAFFGEAFKYIDEGKNIENLDLKRFDLIFEKFPPNEESTKTSIKIVIHKRDPKDMVTLDESISASAYDPSPKKTKRLSEFDVLSSIE